jgi:hypothetical protein
VENPAPDRLGRSEADGIRVFGGLVGHARGMQAAEHDFRAAPPPALGQFVGPAGRRNVGLDAHQIHVALDFGGFDVLVANGDVPVVGREAGDGHQAQRRKLGVLDEPVVFVAGPLHGRKDQQKSAFHGFSSAKTFGVQSTFPKKQVPTPGAHEESSTARSFRSTIWRNMFR